MKCPKCGGETLVKNSRDFGDIRRRRECTDCGHRFSTNEVLSTDLARLHKQANTSEYKDRALIHAAIKTLQEAIKND